MAKIKGDKCLVGQKEQNPLPKRFCGLVNAKLLAAPASLAGAKNGVHSLSRSASCQLGAAGSLIWIILKAASEVAFHKLWQTRFLASGFRLS
jgi:hypothetical protein